MKNMKSVAAKMYSTQFGGPFETSRNSNLRDTGLKALNSIEQTRRGSMSVTKGINRTIYEVESRHQSAEKLLTNNPSAQHMNELNKYIQQLDGRLSLPKFARFKAIGSSENLHEPQPNSPRRFLKDKKHSLLRYDSPTSAKDLHLLSQEERARLQKQRHSKDMRKVSLENRERLFRGIKKGAFELGGVFGGQAPDREPSPHAISNKNLSPKVPQLYNHSQRDPIIVRGA